MKNNFTSQSPGKKKNSKRDRKKTVRIISAGFAIIAICVIVYFLFYQPEYKIIFENDENGTVLLSVFVKDTISSGLININDKLYDNYKNLYRNMSFNYFDDKESAEKLYDVMMKDTGIQLKKVLEHNIAVFLKNKDHDCLVKKTPSIPIKLKCY